MKSSAAWAGPGSYGPMSGPASRPTSRSSPRPSATASPSAPAWPPRSRPPGMTVGAHGSTFGGNPMAMAVGLAAFGDHRRRRLLDNVNQVSGYLGQNSRAQNRPSPRRDRRIAAGPAGRNQAEANDRESWRWPAIRACSSPAARTTRAPAAAPRRHPGRGARSGGEAGKDGFQSAREATKQKEQA